MRGRALVLCTLLAAVPAVAGAQTRRVELGVGGGVAGGRSLGERDAILHNNDPSASAFRLFSSDARLGGAAALEGRVGYRITPRLSIDGILTVARPELAVSLGADAENAAEVEAREPVTEYIVTAGLTWRLSINPRRRWTPIVSGGGGLARHVHAHRAFTDDGAAAYVGAGLIHPVGAGRAGAAPRTAVRLDGRLQLLSGGVAEGSGVAPRGVVTGSVFLTF
jgi:hypothetical protein